MVWPTTINRRNNNSNWIQFDLSLYRFWLLLTVAVLIALSLLLNDVATPFDSWRHPTRFLFCRFTDICFCFVFFILIFIWIREKWIMGAYQCNVSSSYESYRFFFRLFFFLIWSQVHIEIIWYFHIKSPWIHWHLKWFYSKKINLCGVDRFGSILMEFALKQHSKNCYWNLDIFDVYVNVLDHKTWIDNFSSCSPAPNPAIAQNPSKMDGNIHLNNQYFCSFCHRTNCRSFNFCRWNFLKKNSEYFPRVNSMYKLNILYLTV